jgi:hypothetical protein
MRCSTWRFGGPRRGAVWSPILRRCHILGVVRGSIEVSSSGGSCRLRAGDFVLLPAALGQPAIRAVEPSEWLVAVPVTADDRGMDSDAEAAIPPGLARAQPSTTPPALVALPEAAPLQAGADFPERSAVRLPFRRRGGHRPGGRGGRSAVLELGSGGLFQGRHQGQPGGLDAGPVPRPIGACRVRGRPDRGGPPRLAGGDRQQSRGRPALHRGLLESLRDFPQFRPEQGALAIGTASWLLALTGTNLADVILVADVLERYGQPRSALARLAEVASRADDGAEKVRARCLFSAGFYGEFEELWRTNQTTWASDPLLARYQDAWQVATDDRSGGLESALRLKQALEAPGGEGLVAARLLHQAAARRGLAEEVALCVRRLESARSASVGHYAHLWRLLAASGRHSEATNMAVTLKIVPRDPESAVQLVEAFRFLGLREQARRFCEQHIGAYGASTEVWRSYFDLLVEIGNWDEVQRASVDARVLASRNDPLWAEAVFARYRAGTRRGATRPGGRGRRGPAFPTARGSGRRPAVRRPVAPRRPARTGPAGPEVGRSRAPRLARLLGRVFSGRLRRSRRRFAEPVRRGIAAPASRQSRVWSTTAPRCF